MKSYSKPSGTDSYSKKANSKARAQANQRRCGGSLRMRGPFWLTDPKLYKSLDDEFHFDMDPCPYPRPDNYDSLLEPWGKSNYVNPLFVGGPTAWVKKAIDEQQKGNTTVLIFPLDRWVYRLFNAKAEIRSIGFVDWWDPQGNKQKSNRPNFLFILRGEAE